MEKGGYLFAIIPSPIMFKGGGCLNWRKKLFPLHSLKAVVKLPEDLFYPVGVHTSAIIIQKGIPQNNASVFWGVINDGYVKKKGTMVKTSDGTIQQIKNGLISFLNGIEINDNSNFCITKIENDNKLECSPEYYLPEKSYSNAEIQEFIKNSIIEICSYSLKRGKKEIFDNVKKQLATQSLKSKKVKSIEDIFAIKSAKSLNIEDYGNGNIPFVTSTVLNNAVEMFIEPSDKDTKFKAFNITISSFGHANLQVEEFVARSHGAVLILEPKIKLSLQELLFYTACLNLQSWRFSYGRWVTKDRLTKLKLNNIENFDLHKINHIFDNTLKILTF
jgi:hypothetical protein